MTVVVLGGGPAGLAAAVELPRFATREVVVVERESEAGGIPRHAQHQGFGIRDLRRPLQDPRTRAGTPARGGGRRGDPHGDHGHRLVARRAARADRPPGRETLEPDAVILATGCRSGRARPGLCPGPGRRAS